MIAGAGTGKTRAITHRIAYGVAAGVYKPNEVLAVTFTTRAAGEMRERLGRLGAPGVQARTFHSAALRQVRYFWPQVYGSVFPEIVASKFPLVAEATRRGGVRAETALLRDLSSEIEWAKVSNVRPVDYEGAAEAAGREVGDLDPATVASLLATYEDVKRERGRIDMEDILLICAAILDDDEAIAAQVRRQYRWFVVDEFQDVNPLQSALLELWLGGRDEICVVGDPRQTIYSFAGASPRILTAFARRHPGAARIQLVRNYRSTPQIVSAANLVFGRDADGVRLVAQGESGPAVVYRGHSDEPAEAAAVVADIERLHADGVPYADMAVLFRINAQSERFEEALGAARVPFVLRGAEGFFQRAEVRQAVTLLRGSARAGEGGSGTLGDDVRAVLASVGHTDEPPAGRGAVRDRWESLQAIVDMAGHFAEEHPEASVADLVADLDRRAQQAHAPTADGVTLATFHAAKGLEWEAVFCAGVHEGMLPIVHADTPEAVEEERRLFYVGITRARRHLTVSWSASREPGGRGQRKPTRFLDELLPADHPARPGRPRRAAAKDRTPVRPQDAALFESLKAWRREQAEAQSKPAFTVFNDATLEEVARLRPRTGPELRRVHGVGEAKLEKYGADVLRLVTEAGQ